MDTLTRRRFLFASSGLATIGLAGTAGLVTWNDLHRAAAATPLPVGNKILVVLTLYGGNDGLNTLIPYADTAYHDARKDFGYDGDSVLRLDDSWGLNPAMKGMAQLWQQQKLAIVRGVGYPRPDHSHFRSMDIWQTASPTSPVNTGWIGRWLDATGDDPLRAVNIGTVLPPLAVGAKTTAAALDISKAKALPADLAGAFTGLGAADPADTPAQLLVARSYCSERTVAGTFEPITDGADADEGDPDTESPAGEAGGQSDLDRQLQLVARCVKARVPTRVYTVSLGGFDTHADEKATQERQLGEVDAAVSGFFTALQGDPAADDVILMGYSEFGRRVQANASQGTDHGTAGPVFVAGAGVVSGFHAEAPSLTDLDNGDLKATCDFRSVYSEMLDRVLGADPSQVLGSDVAGLGVLS